MTRNDAFVSAEHISFPRGATSIALPRPSSAKTRRVCGNRKGKYSPRDDARDPLRIVRGNGCMNDHGVDNAGAPGSAPIFDPVPGGRRDSAVP